MKTITKLSLLAGIVTAFAGSAALADDSQLQNRLALQRARAEHNKTTVAVYADRHGVRRAGTMQDQRSETRFELRTTARGQQVGAFVPVK